MGAYIDRDELLEVYANTNDLDISDYDVKVAVIRQNILDMPTIDIVRCGECKKHGKNSCPMTFTYAVITDDNNYCTYAERRSE